MGLCLQQHLLLLTFAAGDRRVDAGSGLRAAHDHTTAVPARIRAQVFTSSAVPMVQP